jgi:excisionase family DNA binding protein
MPRPQVTPTASNLSPGIDLGALPHAPGSQPFCPHCSPQSEITRRTLALAVSLPNAFNRGMREEPAYDGQTPSRAMAEASHRQANLGLLTIEQVAAQLRISTKSVRRRIKNGLIRKASLGGRTVRISLDEVQRLAAVTPLEEAFEDPDISQY